MPTEQQARHPGDQLRIEDLAANAFREWTIPAKTFFGNRNEVDKLLPRPRRGRNALASRRGACGSGLRRLQATAGLFLRRSRATSRLSRSRSRENRPQTSTPCKSAISHGCEPHPANRSLRWKQVGR
jgi:hypothetical protein